MSRGINRRRVGIAGIFLLAGCSNSSSGTFLGGAEGSELLLGVVTNGVGLRAYACDGQSIAEWFEGDDIEQPLTSASGATLTIQRGAAPVAELDLGSDRVFTIQTSPVEGSRTGVFRAERNQDGTTIVGGWVVLPDGTQRGSVRQGAVSVFGTVLDLATLTATVQGVGELQAVQLQPGAL